MGGYCERCRTSLPRLSITSTCDQCKEKINRERIEMQEVEKIRTNRQTQKSLEKYKKLRETEHKKSSMVGVFDKFRKYDNDGYDKDGIHKDTGTKFNQFGFDREGYDGYGHDSDGHRREDYSQVTSDNEVKNFARWVHSPSDNFTKEPKAQWEHESEKTTNSELKEKELDIYKKFQEEQRRQKETRDAEIREKENYVFKKFQEEQKNNPDKDTPQNSKDDSIADVLKNLANEIFKENPQQTRGSSYTSKQESNQEYSSPPKPIPQKTIEYSNVPDFSSDDPYCILGVFPGMSLSEINQRRRELLTRYDSSRDMVNRSEKEQKELEHIQGKIHNAWRLINNKT